MKTVLYVHMHMYIYIYTYVYRERSAYIAMYIERKKDITYVNTSVKRLYIGTCKFSQPTAR